FFASAKTATEVAFNATPSLTDGITGYLHCRAGSLWRRDDRLPCIIVQCTIFARKGSIDCFSTRRQVTAKAELPNWGCQRSLPMKKLYPDAEAALDGLLADGLLIAAGGFGLCGLPERLLEAIQASGVKDLTFASNNAGIDNEGIGKL